MYLCIDIFPNRIESILSCLSYILRCYSFHASVSGTGRAHRNYQGVFLRGYGGQTSYHYGAEDIGARG